MSDERERIEALLRIIEEQGLDALSLRLGETSYELIRRDPAAAAHIIAAPPQHDALPSTPAPAPAPQPTNYRKITAPVVGVFYRASSPDAEPFIEVGDGVRVGQVVCILEAMKLMNEITSDYAGIVRRILPENGALVSLGEEIFWIEP